MSGFKKSLLCIVASGAMLEALAVSADANCISSSQIGVTPTGGEIDAAGTEGSTTAASATCWRPDPDETGTVDHLSRITVSHYSLGYLLEEMKKEGFRSGDSLMAALENVRSDLTSHGVNSAAYTHPSDDCHVYAQAADGRPDPTRPVAALWWPAQGGCRALKELIGIAIADHMDGAVLLARAEAEEVRETGFMDVSFEPAPISFAWLFVAYHNVDVSELPAELGFVDRLAERLKKHSFPYRVQDKDTLSQLATALTGAPGNYTLLHALNRERVLDPDMIIAGETIAMPPGVANWAVTSAGDNPAAISTGLYGTPIFASTVAGLCGEETTRAGHTCFLPIWQDSVAVTQALEEGVIDAYASENRM